MTQTLPTGRTKAAEQGVGATIRPQRRRCRIESATQRPARSFSARRSTDMIMNRRNADWSESRTLQPFLWAVVLLLQGCVAAEPNPQVGVHLISKAHDFLNVAAILFSQSPSVWGQGLRSLYYGALTLARVKDVVTFLRPAKEFHSRVWRLSKLPVRRYFDETMKDVRVRYDYEVLPDAGRSAREDFQAFLKEGLDPFYQLLDQTADSIQKDFRRCTGEVHTCPYCKGNSGGCSRDKALMEIETIRQEMKALALAHRLEDGEPPNKALNATGAGAPAR